jgi:hypothetical protein
MKHTSALVVFSILALGVLVAAQTQPAQSPAASSGNDFSGMYSFLQEGEFVQINLEGPGKVTGFISRYGDLPSDKGAFLDQFFKNGSTDGTQVSFTTEPLHSTWFEFKGTVGRGDGKTPNDESYYLLKGKLTKYTEDANKKTTAESREVTFKSFPQDAGLDQPKRD